MAMGNEKLATSDEMPNLSDSKDFETSKEEPRKSSEEKNLKKYFDICVKHQLNFVSVGILTSNELVATKIAEKKSLQEEVVDQIAEKKHSNEEELAKEFAAKTKVNEESSKPDAENKDAKKESAMSTEEKKEMKKHFLVLAESFLTDCAREVFVFASGEKPKSYTACNYYRSIIYSDWFKALCEGEKTSPSELAERYDQMIEKFENLCNTVEVLEEKFVKPAREMIADYPELIGLYRESCQTIANYENLRKNFKL